MNWVFQYSEMNSWKKSHHSLSFVNISQFSNDWWICFKRALKPGLYCIDRRCNGRDQTSRNKGWKQVQLKNFLTCMLSFFELVPIIGANPVVSNVFKGKPKQQWVTEIPYQSNLKSRKLKQWPFWFNIITEPDP